MSQALQMKQAIDIQAAPFADGMSSVATKQSYTHGKLTIKTPAGMQLTMGQKPAPVAAQKLGLHYTPAAPNFN